MPVPGKPTIKFIFDGMILLHFAPDSSSCEAIILRAMEHEFKIKITGLPEGNKKLSSSLQEGDVIFKVNGAENRVKQAVPGNGDFDRIVGGDFERDFRWV